MYLDGLKTRRRMKSSWLPLVLALLASSTAAGGSLGEAAKKEKERREKNKEAGVTPVRTITEDDLKATDSPSESGGTYTASGPAASAPDHADCCGGTANVPSTRSGPSEEERSWRSRAKYARERVESARRKLASTPARITRYTNSYPYQGFITEDNPAYKYAEEELKRAEAALGDLEEDARKQGVLPGWLR
jgi:hypothetical protein